MGSNKHIHKFFISPFLGNYDKPSNGSWTNKYMKLYLFFKYSPKKRLLINQNLLVCFMTWHINPIMGGLQDPNCR